MCPDFFLQKTGLKIPTQNNICKNWMLKFVQGAQESTNDFLLWENCCHPDPHLYSLTVSNEKKYKAYLCDFKIKDKLLWLEILRWKQGLG